MYVIMNMIMIVLSVTVFITSFLNCSTICSRSDATQFLNWKVRETFLVLTTLAVLLLLTCLFGSVLGVAGIYSTSYFLTELLSLVLFIHMLVFNVSLLVILIRNGYFSFVCSESIQILFYIAVMWDFFIERVTVQAEVATILTALLAIVIVIVLVRLFRYLRVMNLIFEPVDLGTSLKLFLVFSMLLSVAEIADIFSEGAARMFFILSVVVALASMLAMDLAINKIVDSIPVDGDFSQ